MKNFLPLLLFAVLLACSEKTQETQTEAYIPELVIKDSLVIDRLTKPYLIDVKLDNSEFLFFDWKTKEFLRIGSTGRILKTADVMGDGKNSIQATYFVGAKYGLEQEILIQTMEFTFVFDLEFNLKEKIENDFELVTRRVGGSRGFDTYGDYLYTFSMEEEDFEKVIESKKFNTSYPFLTLRNIKSFQIVKQDSIPANSHMAKNPGFFANLDPIIQFDQNEMYVLFPNSPEMYVYKFPDLKLINEWDLDPGKDYKLIEPTEIGANDEFFKSLAAGEYIGFGFSNGYLLTAYQAAAPKDEVESLPENMIGGKEFNDLVDKYKSKNIYQIFKEDQKLWEGDLGVNLEMTRNLIFATVKPGEDPNAVEKDVQTIYFYELK